MRITAIAAMDRAGLIGDGLRMPWHLPADLKRFRDRTIERPVIMGRKTHESLSKPLPRRLNIVLTHRPDYQADGCVLVDSIDQALDRAREHLEITRGDEAMIIGGGSIYEATAPLWDQLLLTVVDGCFPGDVYFPVGAVMTPPWRIDAEQFCPADERNRFAHWFLTLGRPGRDPTTGRPGAATLAAWLDRQSGTRPSDRCRGGDGAVTAGPGAHPAEPSHGSSWAR